MATGGLAPAAVDPVEDLSPRRKGLRLGAKLLFASAVLFPVCFGLAVGTDSPAALVFFFAILLAGIARMAYARLFEAAAPPPWVGRPVFPARHAAGMLAPHAPPVAAPRGATTGELQPPPSVTEHSTHLLDR